jgi:hypothetical protein
LSQFTLTDWIPVMDNTPNSTDLSRGSLLDMVVENSVLLIVCCAAVKKYKSCQSS